MSYPRTPTTTTSAATTTPNATPNEHYDASPGTPTVSATPSASTPSKPHRSPNAASLTAIFDADDQFQGVSGRRRVGIVWRVGRCGRCARSLWSWPASVEGRARGPHLGCVHRVVPDRVVP